jgi:hypothetical protein
LTAAVCTGYSRLPRHSVRAECFDSADEHGTLAAERQAQFYAAVSARHGAGEWNLKAFEWAPCEGVADSARVRAFLAARCAKREALRACAP